MKQSYLPILKKLTSILLAIALVFSTVPSFSLAADEDPAQQLKEAADAANKAAGEAEDALKDVTDAHDDAKGLMKDAVDADGNPVKGVENLAKDAADALDAAETALDDADISDELEDLETLAPLAAEGKSDKEIQDAIDAAVGKIEGLAKTVNDAVDEAEKVVEKAKEVVKQADAAGEAAELAVGAANEAMDQAQQAEEAYNELLQAAVDDDPETYAELAAAENAMNEAWDDYADAQDEANALWNEYCDALMNAVGKATDAKEAADAAQDEANRLLDIWQGLEDLMQDALADTGDAQLADWEKMRADARDAALKAMEHARDANEKAAETYALAQEAVALANGAVAGVAGMDDEDDAAWEKIIGMRDELIVAAEGASYKGTPGTDTIPGTETPGDLTRKEGATKQEVGKDLPAYVVFKDGQLKDSNNNDVLVVLVFNSEPLSADEYRALLKKVVDNNWTENGVIKILDGATYMNPEGTQALFDPNKLGLGIDSNHNFGLVHKDGVWYAVKEKGGNITGEISNLFWVSITTTPEIPGTDPIPGETFTAEITINIPEALEGIELGSLTLGELYELARLGVITIPEIEEEERERERITPNSTPVDPVNIPEEPAPLADAPVEDTIDILEEDVPLAAMPQTGVANTMIFWMLGLLAAVCVTVVSFIRIRAQKQS